AVGRRPEAEAQLKEVLAIDPRNVLANRAVALFYVASQRAADAEPYFKTAAEVSPNPAGKLTLADYYQGMGRSADSRRILEDIAAKGGSGAAQAKMRLGGLAAGSGDTAGAMRAVN